MKLASIISITNFFYKKAVNQEKLAENRVKLFSGMDLAVAEMQIVMIV